MTKKKKKTNEQKELPKPESRTWERKKYKYLRIL